MVVVDRLSKYIHFISLKTYYTVKQVVDAFFANMAKLHGVPKSIVPDRDKVFSKLLMFSLLSECCDNPSKPYLYILRGSLSCDHTDVLLYYKPSSISPLKCDQSMLLWLNSVDGIFLNFDKKCACKECNLHEIS